MDTRYIYAATFSEIDEMLLLLLEADEYILCARLLADSSSDVAGIWRFWRVLVDIEGQGLGEASRSSIIVYEECIEGLGRTPDMQEPMDGKI
jgi:hypothetical protein